MQDFVRLKAELKTWNSGNSLQPDKIQVRLIQLLYQISA